MIHIETDLPKLRYIKLGQEAVKWANLVMNSESIDMV